MRIAALVSLVGMSGFFVTGCEKHEFDPPDREAQIEEADSLYSPARFDTVAWESPRVRGREGNAVYAATCRRCHGTLGGGETEYARERGLQVPSLVRPDPAWESVNEVRRRIFTGHAEGMPTFGIVRLTPREIDAVAFYVLEILRADAIGSSEAEGGG